MFLGTFTPKLLGSGQIALPSRLRNALGSSRAVITSGFEHCVYGFSVADWEKTSSFELAKPLSTEEGRKIRRKMFAAAIEVDLDEQGRFVIPDYLKEYAGIDSEIVVAGAGDHFEIWDASEFKRITSET